MNQTVLDTLLQTTFTNVAGWMKDIYINSEIKKIQSHVSYKNILV